MDTVATNLQPLDYNRVASPLIKYVSCEIDARVVPVVSIWKMLIQRSKHPMCNGKPLQISHLAKWEFYITQCPQNTQQTASQSVGQLRQICFAQEGGKMINYGRKQHGGTHSYTTSLLIHPICCMCKTKKCFFQYICIDIFQSTSCIRKTLFVLIHQCYYVLSLSVI